MKLRGHEEDHILNFRVKNLKKKLQYLEQENEGASRRNAQLLKEIENGSTELHMLSASTSQNRDKLQSLKVTQNHVNYCE
jgi:hypothetical protein